MIKLITKALIIGWPFLRSIIFKDRTVKEVLLANRQFTCLFGLLVVVVFTLYLTVATLAETKALLLLSQAEAARLKTQLESSQADTRPQADHEVLLTATNCVPVAYDKSRLLQILE
jgi:hypothetical protein